VRENDCAKYNSTDFKNIRKSFPNSKSSRSSFCVFGEAALERLGGILEPTLGAQDKNGQVRQTTAQEPFASNPLTKLGTIEFATGLGLEQPGIAQAG
jgi:hypothetical protein